MNTAKWRRKNWGPIYVSNGWGLVCQDGKFRTDRFQTSDMDVVCVWKTKRVATEMAIPGERAVRVCLVGMTTFPSLKSIRMP